MGIFSRLLVTTAAISGVAAFLADGAAAAPTCFGRPATIVVSGGGHHRVEGTKSADVIVVRGGSATVRAGRGKDRICTAGGTDRIYGGRGADRISSGRGRDVIRAGKGDDLVRAGRGHDSVRGGKGSDRIRGGRGFDLLRGGASTDRVWGGPHDDTIYLGRGRTDSALGQQSGFGGPGNDEIYGSDSHEDIFGGPGNDLIRGRLGTTAELVGGIDHLHGQGGDDHIISGRAEGEPIESRSSFSYGGKGDDVLEDLDGGGVLAGGPGDDVLRAPEEPGATRLDYLDSAAAVVVDLPSGIATGEGTDVISGSIVYVEGSEFDDELIGDDKDNHLSGNGGHDRLRGGGGNDRLEGGAGDDELVGGAGEDLAAFPYVERDLTVDLSQGTAEGEGSDTLTEVENIFSNGGNHLLIGDDSVNHIKWSGSYNFMARVDARGGHDVIDVIGDAVVDGGKGNDAISAPAIRNGELRGGPGDDSFRFKQPYAGAGGEAVRVNGDEGVDVIDFRGSSYSAEVDLVSGSATFDSGIRDGTFFELVSIENIFGSFLADMLAGDDGANWIVGGDGNDEILGRAGDDELDGGDGRDHLDGGEGTDRCVNGEQVENCEL